MGGCHHNKILGGEWNVSGNKRELYLGGGVLVVLYSAGGERGEERRWVPLPHIRESSKVDAEWTLSSGPCRPRGGQRGGKFKETEWLGSHPSSLLEGPV